MPSGKLYLVPTPIGNLGDITYRAVELLKAVDIICAEDTRRTRILCDRYGIGGKLISYHNHNAVRRAREIVGWIGNGQTVALVSDAGSPGISDPGFRAVRAVIEAGMSLEVLPGASSVIPALVLSGLGVDRFTFEGFLPVKKGRKTRLETLVSEPRTMIFFEGPHRLLRTLNDLIAHLGADRRAAVARELTKIHEEVRRETLTELSDYYTSKTAKGEIVIVVEGNEAYNKRFKTEK